MKNFLILPVILLGFFGCSDFNEPLTTNENEKTLLSDFMGNDILSYYSEIKSLNEDYPIEITSAGGSKIEKDKAVGFYYADYENIMKSCKIVLTRNDVKKTTGFFDLQDTFKITNQAILDKIDNCVKNHLQNTPIKNDELAYFLADDRIKKNIHYPFLKDSIKNATKDKKITYNEIFDIYRNLDKAIETNLSADFDKINSDLNGEIE